MRVYYVILLVGTLVRFEVASCRATLKSSRFLAIGLILIHVLCTIICTYNTKCLDRNRLRTVDFFQFNQTSKRTTVTVIVLGSNEIIIC